jgi:hypothetical protein
MIKHSYSTRSKSTQKVAVFIFGSFLVTGKPRVGRAQVVSELRWFFCHFGFGIFTKVKMAPSDDKRYLTCLNLTEIELLDIPKIRPFT